jgi:hypothetical protein
MSAGSPHRFCGVRSRIWAERSITPDAVFVHEDGDINITGKNNDLFDCLPDGADADGFTNGCIRIATLNDLISNAGEGAEWTGGIFDQTGKRFFVSGQHNMTGFGVVLEVTGWK